MKKNNLMIAVVFGVIVLAAGGFLLLNQNQSKNDAMMKDKEKMMSDDTTVKKDDAMMEDNAMSNDDAMMKDDSRYVAFSNSTLTDTSDSKRVLFFYANWCPICRPADKEFQENTNKIPADVTLIRVNYNDSDTDQTEKDLAKKYSVTYQHTFVQIDENGNEISKWSGGAVDELLANVK